ncbi:hypothetical protein C8R45DRAFT_1131109 [Mycena sanguinolenta]|nr:hypothetical protein C8R45DRAFT_1131109 [Mycena sanguinolenta]
MAVPITGTSQPLAITRAMVFWLLAPTAAHWLLDGPFFSTQSTPSTSLAKRTYVHPRLAIVSRQHVFSCVEPGLAVATSIHTSSPSSYPTFPPPIAIRRARAHGLARDGTFQWMPKRRPGVAARAFPPKSPPLRPPAYRIMRWLRLDGDLQPFPPSLPLRGEDNDQAEYAPQHWTFRKTAFMNTTFMNTTFIDSIGCLRRRFLHHRTHHDGLVRLIFVQQNSTWQLLRRTVVNSQTASSGLFVGIRIPHLCFLPVLLPPFSSYPLPSSSVAHSQSTTYFYSSIRHASSYDFSLLLPGRPRLLSSLFFLPSPPSLVTSPTASIIPMSF